MFCSRYIQPFVLKYWFRLIEMFWLKAVGCFFKKKKFCWNKSLSANGNANLVCNFGGKCNDHRFQLHYSVAESSHWHHQDLKPGPTLQVTHLAFMIPNILRKRKIFPWPNWYNVCINTSTNKKLIFYSETFRMNKR